MLLPKRKVNWKLMRENLLEYEQQQKNKLYQRMINALASQEERLKNEDVKQLRLQRKLEKSRKK